MELGLIRSLMDKEFYDNHRGAKCPDRLFSKDVRAIKKIVDEVGDNPTELAKRISEQYGFAFVKSGEE